MQQTRFIFLQFNTKRLSFRIRYSIKIRSVKCTYFFLIPKNELLYKSSSSTNVLTVLFLVLGILCFFYSTQDVKMTHSTVEKEKKSVPTRCNRQRNESS